jgi:hypothetical protein
MAGFTIDRLAVNGTDDMHVPEVHRRCVGNIILITGTNLKDVQLSSVSFFPFPDLLNVFGLAPGGPANHNDHLGIWKFQAKLGEIILPISTFAIGMKVTFELAETCKKTFEFLVLVERK